jgi:hypothetical protein
VVGSWNQGSEDQQIESALREIDRRQYGPLLLLQNDISSLVEVQRKKNLSLVGSDSGGSQPNILYLGWTP